MINTVKRPKLLDLFSGAGGAGYGYYLAGFDVTGVDHNPQKRYPQNEHMRFVQADALEYALSHGWQYDAIHASPPCQTHSQITKKQYRANHEDLIPHTRFVLETLGLPYIIENVYGAKNALRNPVMLCGAQFGLKVYRHRLFESNILLLVPSHVPHDDTTPPAGHGVSPKGFVSITSGGNGIKEVQYQYLPDEFSGDVKKYHHWAAGVGWMVNDELAQVIPPAYTQYLGRQLMRHIVNQQPCKSTTDDCYQQRITK